MTLKFICLTPVKDEAWSLEFGSIMPAVQVPSRFEKDVVRTLSNPTGEFRNSHARTPHHLLSGTVTPNSLHFSINHSGVPDIDPAKCPSEDFLSPLNHLDSMEPILIRGRGFHCGRIRTGRGMTAIT